MTLDDAFLRAITENPDDDTPRLIYADWLEERGDPRGEFIRIQIAVAHERYCAARRLPLEARERELLEHHQDTWLGTLRPMLTRWSFRRGFLDTVAVPASVYLQHTAIPRPATVRRFEVDLTGFEIPLSVLELLPESVARENICLSLGLRGRTQVIAKAYPQDDDMLMKLEFILNREIELVAATKKQLIESINRHYGQIETESVDTPVLEYPVDRKFFERSCP